MHAKEAQAYLNQHSAKKQRKDNLQLPNDCILAPQSLAFVYAYARGYNCFDG